MGEFDSGVVRYVHAQAVVDVFCPVDAKGNADISCNQCPFFRRQSSRCGLNETLCAFPQKYVGQYCPLPKTESEEN